MDLNSSKPTGELSKNILSANNKKNGFEKNLFKNRSSSFLGNKLPQPPALQNHLSTPILSNRMGSFSNTDTLSYGSRSSKGSQTTVFSENNLLPMNSLQSTELKPLPNPSISQFGHQPLPGLKFNQQNLVPHNNNILPLKHSLQGVQFINPFQQRETMIFGNSTIPLMQRDRSNEPSSATSIFKQDFSPFLKQSFESSHIHQQQQQQQQQSKLKNFNDNNVLKQSFYSPSRFYHDILNQSPQFENYNVKYEEHMNPSQKTNLTLKKTKARPKCDLCFKSFSRQSSLKTHITTVHKKIKNYECPYSNCNKRFSTNSNMRRHVRIHEKNNKLHIKKAQLMESAIGELEAIRKHEENNFNQENNEHSKDQQY